MFRCSDHPLTLCVCEVISITNDVEDYGNASVRHVSQILRCFIGCETLLQETLVMMKGLTKANHVYCVFRFKMLPVVSLVQEKEFLL